MLHNRITLTELCSNYIDNSHTLEGQKTANEKIYTLCSDYLTDSISNKGEHQLRQYFNIP